MKLSRRGFIGALAAVPVLAPLAKVAGELPAVEGEAFTDGLITGRGHYDFRLELANNDLGAIDPQREINKRRSAQIDMMARTEQAYVWTGDEYVSLALGVGRKSN